ncbi:MAG: hypothetical protein J1E63_07125 [Muribaculaceae bacterium]|nr:hypothetical protein [Muribaculaceae bacterium]
MKKLLLFAAIMAAVVPVARTQETADSEDSVKSFCVGEFENPGTAEFKMGAGSFWEKAPVNFYTRYSGLQIIYDAKYLQPLADDNGAITEIVFKMGDEGSFGYVEADLTLYIQNIEDKEFVKKEDTEKYLWKIYDTTSSCSKVDYVGEFYYMEDQEFHFVLDKPMQYEGENLLVTISCVRTNDEEVNTLCTYAMGTDSYNMMMMCSDRDDETFEDIYATKFQFPYMGPEKYIPVTKFYYTEGANSGIASVVGETSTPVYFNLQGMQVANPTGGIYLRRQGNEVKKVIIK